MTTTSFIPHNSPSHKHPLLTPQTPSSLLFHQHETASEKKEQERQRDESHNENDTTPLVSGDKVKPHSNSVTNRENFHVHGLYPPLGSLGKRFVVTHLLILHMTYAIRNKNTPFNTY